MNFNIENGKRFTDYTAPEKMSDDDLLLTRSADGSGVHSSKLSEIRKQITGDLTGLPTNDKESIVAAISEQQKGIVALDQIVGASDNREYLKKSGTGLKVSAGVLISVNGSTAITEETTIALPSGATVGDDYLVYASIENGALKYTVSKIAMTGAYRLIGGFHYGRIRNSTTATDVSEGIVPNSVWTQLHRPKCDPTGMVYCGNGMWADIYIMSGNPVTSKYGASPRVNVTWYDTWNLLRAVGKRMPSYGEWCAIAEGSPEGQDGNNTYARSATSNTSAGVTGDVRLAISSLNVVDCAGRVWEWVDELCLDPTATTWAWQDIEANAGHGDMYIPSATALRALFCGGNWNNGVHDGSRAVYADFYPWNASGDISGRGVCDSL